MKAALILDDVADSQVWLSHALNTAFDGLELRCTGNLVEARAWLAREKSKNQRSSN